MLKNILNLEEVKDLTKEAQKSIKGGFHPNILSCTTRRDCFITTGEFDWACENGRCIPL